MLEQLQPADITLLRVFTAVCECRGVAAAADRLGVAPSTVSTQLLDLEFRLGLTLCKRGRAGFSMTPDGERVLVYSFEIFEQMQQFTRDVGVLKGSLSGQLTIGILDNTTINHPLGLSQMLRRFRSRFPNILFQVEISPQDQLEQSVLDRRFDIGIGVREYGLSNLVYEKLYDEFQVVCCARGHQYFNLDSNEIDIAHLFQSNWISDIYTTPIPLPEASPPYFTSYVTTLEAGLHLIFSGSYLGVMPREFIRGWIEQGEIKTLLEDELSFTHELSVITHANRKSDVLTSSFLSIVHEMLEQQGEFL